MTRTLVLVVLLGLTVRLSLSAPSPPNYIKPSDMLSAYLDLLKDGAQNSTDVTTTDTPTTPEPTTTTTTTTTSTTTPPTTKTPTTEAPTTKEPTTEAPTETATKVLTTEPPTTEQPTTEAPTTVPNTEKPTTKAAVVQEVTTPDKRTTTVASENAIEACRITECEPGLVLDDKKCKCYKCLKRSDPTKTGFYLVNVWGRDVSMPCPPGTDWRDDLCNCGTPLIPVATQAPAYASCQTLIDYRYDEATGRFSSNGNVWIQSEYDVEVEPVQGATFNETVSLINNSVEFPYLHGNDLTGTALFELRVAMVGQSENVSRVILSNGCNVTSGTEEVGEPSVKISFNSAELRFDILLKTDEQQPSTGVCKGAYPDQLGWYKLRLSVKDSVTTFSYNDVECAHFEGSGPIAKTACGLTAGADPFEIENPLNFDGYLDYLKVIKHCSTDPNQSTVAPQNNP